MNDFNVDLSKLCPTDFGKRHLQKLDAGGETLKFSSASDAYLSGAQNNRLALKEDSMNSIIYIVGLVVIIGIVLSYFGFR